MSFLLAATFNDTLANAGSGSDGVHYGTAVYADGAASRRALRATEAGDRVFVDLGISKTMYSGTMGCRIKAQQAFTSALNGVYEVMKLGPDNGDSRVTGNDAISIVLDYDGSPDGWWVRIRNGLSITTVITDGLDIADDEDMHIAVAWETEVGADDGVLLIYINHVLVAAGTLLPGQIPTCEAVTIGGNGAASTADLPCECLINDAFVYDGILDYPSIEVLADNAIATDLAVSTLTYPTNALPVRTIPDDMIVFEISADGTQWGRKTASGGNRYELYKRSGPSGAWSLWHDFTSGVISAVFETSDGTLLVGLADDGLYRTTSQVTASFSKVLTTTNETGVSPQIRNGWSIRQSPSSDQISLTEYANPSGGESQDTALKHYTSANDGATWTQVDSIAASVSTTNSHHYHANDYAPVGHTLEGYAFKSIGDYTGADNAETELRFSTDDWATEVVVQTTSSGFDTNALSMKAIDMVWPDGGVLFSADRATGKSLLRYYSGNEAYRHTWTNMSREGRLSHRVPAWGDNLLNTYAVGERNGITYWITHPEGASKPTRIWRSQDGGKTADVVYVRPVDNDFPEEAFRFLFAGNTMYIGELELTLTSSTLRRGKYGIGLGLGLGL